jgi:hypothetical protein
VATSTTRAVGRVDFTLPWLGLVMMWLSAPLAKVGILAVSIIGLALPQAVRRSPGASAESALAAAPATATATVPTRSYEALERELQALLPTSN